MNAPMRMAPSCSIFGATSTSTSARATGFVGVGADRHHRRDATERRAHEHRRFGERPGDRVHVAGERLGSVVAVVGPVALAVAAQIDAVGRAIRARRARAPSIPTRTGSARRRGAARRPDRRGRRTRRPAVADRRDRARSIERMTSVPVIGSGSRRGGHRVAADVLVRDVAVGGPLARHAEHALGDEVALDLVAAAREARRLAFEEVLARAPAEGLGAGRPGDARRVRRARAGWWSCARPTSR